MKISLVAIIIICSVLALCAWALSMATEYGPGPIVHQPTWPSGLAGVLNSHERAYGYWVGYSEDHIFYTGSPAEFRSFVRRLSELNGAPIAVIIHDQPGFANRLSGDSTPIPFDWEIAIARDPKGRASEAEINVHLWTGRHIRMSDVRVPKGVVILRTTGADAVKSIMSKIPIKKAPAR